MKTDKGNTLSGYAATFNNLSHDLGGFRETIAPGAFSRSLRSNADVMALSEHNAHKGILGRTKSGTLRLNEDKVGLRFECDLPDTQLGRDIAESVGRGDLDSCSFGFVAKDQSWDRSTGEAIRSLIDLDIFDVSIVANPAYPNTSVALRSLMFPDGAVQVPEFRDDAKEKTVDGEVLHADDFLIVGNADDPETWKLPYKFSTEEKAKSHLRDALSRFDQLEGVSAEEKEAAHTKLVKLAEEHGITVNPDDKRSLDQMKTDTLLAALIGLKVRSSYK